MRFLLDGGLVSMVRGWQAKVAKERGWALSEDERRMAEEEAAAGGGVGVEGEWCLVPMMGPPFVLAHSVAIPGWEAVPQDPEVVAWLHRIDAYLLTLMLAYLPLYVLSKVMTE